jgi:predicted nuclease of predicted toxin-antitoxin system
VTLLVDMNLPPAFASALESTGFSAVHWSDVGAPTADDSEILAWARQHGRVLITHDLDFSAILAASGDDAPSVVQLRAQDMLAPQLLQIVRMALTQHSVQLRRGALLSINEAGTRVRVLPLNRG